MLTDEEYSISLNVNAQYTKYVIFKHYVARQAAEKIFRMPLRKKFKVKMLKKTVLYCTQLDLSPLIHIIVTGVAVNWHPQRFFEIGFPSELVRMVAKG